MAISEKKMQIVIDNYFKLECDVNTSIRQAFEKGFRVGVKKATSELEQSVGKWIPVSEKVPKKEKNAYWVCTDGGCQCECRWTNTSLIWGDLTVEWHWNRIDIPKYHTVIAWMPLPEPYREVDHE